MSVEHPYEEVERMTKELMIRTYIIAAIMATPFIVFFSWLLWISVG